MNLPCSVAFEVGAEYEDAERFIVRSDEKLTASVELESSSDVLAPSRSKALLYLTTG